jgi:hypothetical protein
MIRAKRIERLVKRKPTFRAIEESDWPVIAVAYERGAFDFQRNLSAMDLRQRLEVYEQQGYLLSVVDDANSNFRAGHGLVGLIKTKFDGWAVEPELYKFPWATRFNVVRGVVAFLLDMKRSKMIGVCVVTCRDSSQKFIERMTELKLLFRCGFIPNGYPDSAMWLFNISGRQKRGTK